jgi:hypothetical protein
LNRQAAIRTLLDRALEDEFIRHTGHHHGNSSQR